MLKELNCNEAQLKVAAAFSGQDHITGVGGFGIKKTLERIRNIKSPIPNGVFDVAIKRLSKKLRPQGKTAKAEAQYVINLFLEGTASIRPEFTDQFLQKMDQDEESVMEKFLHETKVNEAKETVFRRPGLRDNVLKELLYRSNPQWERVHPKRSFTRNHQEYLEKQRQSRLEAVSKRVQNKTFPFSFNILEVLDRKNSVADEDSDSDESDNDSASDDSSDDSSDEEEGGGNSVKVVKRGLRKAVSGQDSRQPIIYQRISSVSAQCSDRPIIDHSSPIIKEEVNLKDFKNLNKSLYQRRARDLGKFENCLLQSLKDQKFADHVIYSIKQLKVNTILF